MSSSLSGKVLSLIEEHGHEADTLTGSNTLETLALQACICRTLDQVWEWIPCVDLETTSEEAVGSLELGFTCLGADWWLHDGLLEDRLLDNLRIWFRCHLRDLGMLNEEDAASSSSATTARSFAVSSVLRRSLQRRASTLEGRAMQYEGTSYADTILSLTLNLLRWDISEYMCEDIDELDPPVALVAFAFGTGGKRGHGKCMPTLVGPGFEAPGGTNSGLASAVAGIARRRQMPVYAQWEVADALLYGRDGAPDPVAASYAKWEFSEDEEEDRGRQQPDHTKHLYPLQEAFRFTCPSSGECKEVKIFKAVSIWPKVAKDRGSTLAEFASSDLTCTWRGEYYLSTRGVIEQISALWHGGRCDHPKSALIVAHHDHGRRCIELMEAPNLTVKLAGRTLMPKQHEWAEVQCDCHGFDPSSSQPWTRNRVIFLAREMLVRCGGVFQQIYSIDRHGRTHKFRFLG